jgi:pimeloyl-ACP methyl ester carboxylesterase
MSNIAEDLRPYFAMGTYYDVIIGHSFGGPVTLSLLPFLPKTQNTTVILLDPALELTEEKIKMNAQLVENELTRIRTPEEHMVDNPAWSRRDCISRVLGMAMCDRNAIEMFRVLFQFLRWLASLTGSVLTLNSKTRRGLSVG